MSQSGTLALFRAFSYFPFQDKLLTRLPRVNVGRWCLGQRVAAVLGYFFLNEFDNEHPVAS